MTVTGGTEDRFLIVNADDFGASTGVNRGIAECHARGIVTSASLMVTGRALREAVAISRDHPELSVGLHWDVWGEDEREFDLRDHGAVREEFRRQLAVFEDVMGRRPTHVDTHRHAHRHAGLLPVFLDLVRPLGVPFREDGRVRFVGDFYAQWEWQVTELEHIGVPALLDLLRHKVDAGWTELSCHPGYRSPDYAAVYLDEREVEVRTLCDARVARAIADEGIRLVGYGDHPVLAAP